MEMAGTRQIAAQRSVVWAALNDPEVLKACIPGCKEMTRAEDGGFEALVVQKVGPVSATFKGAVTLSDIVEGQSYRISGEGKGGAAGCAKGGADVMLTDAGDGTELTYAVDAHVGGKLAQLGSRIIDGFARKMADQFFDRFQAAVEEPETVDAAETDDNETDDAGADAPGGEEKKKGWFRRMIG